MANKFVGFPTELTKLPGGHTFSEFLRALDASYLSYLDYITIDGRIPDGIYTVRLEEADDILPDLMRYIVGRNIDFELPRLNVGKKPRPVEMTDEDVAIIQRKFAWCFDVAYDLAPPL